MNAQELLRNAQNLVTTGNMGAALKLCEDFCIAHPDSEFGWNTYGTLRGQSGDAYGAEQCFRRALSIAPKNVQLKISLAKALLNQNKTGDAAAILREIILIDANNREALQALGNISAKEGNIEDAIRHFSALSRLDPGNSRLRHHIALLHKAAGQPTQAIASLQQIVSAQPSNAPAHNDLAALYQEISSYSDAERHYLQSTSIEPHNPTYLYNLGNLYRQLERFDDAIAALVRATTVKPDFTEAHNALGLCYFELFSFESALRAFRRATDINPSFLEAQFNLANTLLHLGSLDEARDAYRTCLSLKPDLAKAKLGLAATLEKSKALDEAYDLIVDIMRSQTDRASAAPLYGVICSRLKRHDEAARILEDIVKTRTDSDIHLVRTHFALGDLYNEIGQYDKAFGHYRNANEISAAPHSIEKIGIEFDKRIANFSRDALSHLPKAPASRRQHIFIVGMPRSGTSLVEKILDSHASIYGAGELPHIARIAASIQRNLGSDLPYPDCISAMTPELIERFSGYYQDRIDELAPGTSHVVDKMPYNFTDLGLIHMLFPGAKLIHCTRDPLDTCLSIYFHEFSKNHPYSTNLESLGHYYNFYRKLMRHWMDAIPSRIFDVSYESLIENPEGIISELIEFLELPWDPNCLAFHENKKHTNTPSYDQVSKPIYTSSRERWRNYERHIHGIRAIIGSAPDNHGPSHP